MSLCPQEIYILTYVDGIPESCSNNTMKAIIALMMTIVIMALLSPSSQAADRDWDNHGGIYGAAQGGEND